jgi:hypothetical protein
LEWHPTLAQGTSELPGWRKAAPVVGPMRVANLDIMVSKLAILASLPSSPRSLASISSSGTTTSTGSNSTICARQQLLFPVGPSCLIPHLLQNLILLSAMASQKINNSKTPKGEKKNKKI